MSVEHFGEPLTGVYSIPGGQARLYERGVTVNGVSASFAFPMIGRPSIVTGSSESASPFEPDAINFRLGDSQLEHIEPLIRHALAGRLSLVPTRQATGQIPLTIGAAAVVTPAPGVGGISALYGLSVTSTALRERQLYDVAALADGGQWRIISPHAVYHRQSWSNFGIAHITDIHVARRIDRFRELLVQADRSDAAQRMFNFNDRFRGFVRYANYLYGIGVLDVILATGDMIDYIFEDDDDPDGGGNNEFMRKLILGQAPGPDFPDVEELLVPILMVPGNHDYRKNPYRLLADIHIRIDGFDKDVTRIKQFAPYHLMDADALALDNVMEGRSADANVENITPESAARMVEVDPEIKSYKTFLADRRSYVARLGKHRVAMLDSAHDVGIVTGVVEGLYVLIKQQDEDKVTFLGGSPNSAGVSPEALAMVSDALTEVPDDGLFIVGVHAPLCNPWREEYPYFLRETQRAAQPGQTQAFLARHDKIPVYANSESVEQQVERRHPAWFPGEHDNRAPTFVTRRDSQDLLDFGVSRGQADPLMGLLAGIGSRRPADVVLSGHTHNLNEFSVRKTHTGELAYSMDFYTQNPFRYYPSRFTRRWRPGISTTPNASTLVPETDVTNVEVVPGAAPDARPWTIPYDTSFTNQIHVPPYPNPLNAAPDPRAWWPEHRPIVLQTAAYGPLKVLDDFAGFRVLSVKNDVIDRIHFVPTGRLEEHQYRLAWEDAIRPQPLRQYRYMERSRPLNAPKAVGTPAGIVFPALGVNNVVYRDDAGRLHALWQKGSESRTNDLTDLARTNRAKGNPTLFIEGTGGSFVALYRGNDDHVYGLHWSTSEVVGGDSLSLTAGAPATGGNPVGFVQVDGTNIVVYRTSGNNLQTLRWKGVDLPETENITPADAPPAVGDPAAFVNTNTGHNIIVYRGNDRHIHSIYWAGFDPVAHNNLSAVAEAPTAAGDPVGYYTRHNDEHQVIYRADDNHIHELWWQGIERVRQWDVTAVAGAPPAASDPVAYYSAGSNTKHYLYRGSDNHLHEIWVIPGGMPTHVDITLEARAPLATDKPAAFVIAGPDTHHAMYRGADGQIHEIRWISFAPRITPRVGVQTDWRWCNKCQGLFYGPTFASSTCPAGGTHASATQSGSADYMLSDDTANPSLQSDWRWCNRCRGLFYGPGVANSRCPAGGAHATPAQSGSANYCLSYGTGGPGRQTDWRWCNKCQGLFYGPGVGSSRCPAGGTHAAPAQSGSGDYSLAMMQRAVVVHID